MLQVRQSSFANLETKCRGISHKSDSGYFIEVEGQRWGIELVMAHSVARNASWKCPCFYLDITSAWLLTLSPVVRASCKCFLAAHQIFLANPSCLVRNVYDPGPYIIKNAGILDKA